MSFMEQLRLRRKKLADVLSDDEYSGIRQIVEELYPDQAHFIYELLQNAEDTGATEVNFHLENEKLVFEHNGRPFNEKDIERITNIGKRETQEETERIGRFGIGFKAVFAYSETPHIWSPTYSFKITELVLPWEIPLDRNPGDKTRFEFPFNNPKKPQENAYGEISSGLKELSETTLLFLRNIESVGWKLPDNTSGEVLRIPHSKYHVEVLKQINNKDTSSSHFLRFSTPLVIDGRSSQSVSVAYHLEFLPDVLRFNPDTVLSKQLKIGPANPGRVAVFFPAEKETSGLRFHLHAPFVPELSRASIKETAANDPLFVRIKELVVSSLHDIKALGLLTGEFLAVLPNPQDSIPARYATIRQSIIEAMNNEPLTPTHFKSHAPAKNLIQSKASLKELLSDEDIEFLIEYEDNPPQWAIGASQRNSNQDRFLVGLGIKTWDIEDFVELLSSKAQEKDHPWQDGPDEDFMNWLAEKPPKWHQQMYSILYKELSEEGNFHPLKSARIIRLSNGAYSKGDKCYFPTDEIEHDEALPRVDRLVYKSGKNKNQQEAARKFLVETGVREVGETEQVEGILKKRYTYEARIPGKNTYRRDLRRFVTLVEHDPYQSRLFGNFYIFQGDDDQWVKPSQIFLDLPFMPTGLSAFYRLLDDESVSKVGLSKNYRHCGIDKDKLVQFARAVGVIDKLEVKLTSCYQNPRWDYLSAVPGQRRHDTSINNDYLIENLDRLIENTKLDLSKLVWKTICDLDEKYLNATYQNNNSSGCRIADSQLVHQLKNAAWIPQKNGKFVCPCDASPDQLPKGFPFDGGLEWLKKVDFGINAQKRTEEYKLWEKVIENLGFVSVDEAKKMSTLASFCREQGKSPDDLIFQFTHPKFPAKKTANPDRRKEKIVERFAEAPEKEYEDRERSVRTTRGAIDPSLWLKEQYTNEDGQMVCQICKQEMPFKKLDGEYYFEAVEALSKKYFSKEHEAQFLALCPLCAAMYKELVKRDESAMADLRPALLNMDSLEAPLQLGDLETTIQFVEPHLCDIKTILEEMGECESEYKIGGMDKKT